MSYAFESTIYISIESVNGEFENAEYRLNGYQIRITDNLFFVNNKKIVSILNKKFAQISLDNSHLKLTLDGELVHFNNVN